MNEDMVIQKLLEHDKKFEELENKIDDLRREVLGVLDYVIKLIKKVETEQAAFHHALMRHEERITRLEIHNHLI